MTTPKAEERESKHAALRAAVEEGLASGEPQKFDLDEFLSRKRREHRARLAR